MLIRQAHPGPGVPPYRTFDDKLRDARRLKSDDAIRWPVLVDDLEGTVHQVYSGLADPTYLIDVDGRVAYFSMWTHAPNLHRAIEALMKQGGRGEVNGGIDHLVHVLPTITHGWRGIRRGLWQSYLDLETASPGMGSGLWLGYQLRPVLGPLTLRSKPLPRAVKGVIAAGALAATALTVRSLRDD